MQFDLLHTLAGLKIGKLVAAEDFADKFHYQLTCILLFFLLTVVSLRQYVFSPIQCWIPAEWKGSWEQFSENYCWVENTYFSNKLHGPQRSPEERKLAKIGYYQWVPFILLIQALTFYLPHIIWRILSRRLGTDINSVVRIAHQCLAADTERREQLVNYLANEIHLVVSTSAHRRQARRQQPIVTQLLNCSYCTTSSHAGRRSGRYLVVVYLFIKLIYLAVAFGNLHLVRIFYKVKVEGPQLFYGAWLLRDILSGHKWELSGNFPRVTWCDVPRVFLGSNANLTRSIMCIIPLNMLIEKIIIILWIWFMLCCLLTILSLLVWITRLVLNRCRDQFIHKLLAILDFSRVYPDGQKSEINQKVLRKFGDKFLGVDGIFLLQMISTNACEIVAAEVLNKIWQLWRDKQDCQMLLKEDHSFV